VAAKTSHTGHAHTQHLAVKKGHESCGVTERRVGLDGGPKTRGYSTEDEQMFQISIMI